LRSAGVSGGIRRAAGWLRDAQNGDGGWGSNPSGRSDPDSTGSALQALGVTGGGMAVDRGVRYLKRTQKREGGWGIYETGVTNSQSTAFAVMGLVAAGVDPASVRRRGRSGLTYLARRQAADGRYAYSQSSDQTPVWVTSQALLALGREALPIEPVARSHGAPRPEPDLGSPDEVGEEAPASPAEEPAPDRGGGAGRSERERTPRVDERSRADRAPPSEDADREQPRFALAESVAQTTAAHEETGSDTEIWVAAGFGGLAALLGGGFVWYRRRLPG
jgi:Squalene-hopene cyclase C-terminal domain